METNWSGAHTNPAKKKKMELAWTQSEITWWQHCHTSTGHKQWTPQDHKHRGRPKNTWKRDLKKEMWTAGFRYSWRKMEAAAQDRAGWDKWSVVYASLGATRFKSSKSIVHGRIDGVRGRERRRRCWMGDVIDWTGLHYQKQRESGDGCTREWQQWRELVWSSFMVRPSGIKMDLDGLKQNCTRSRSGIQYHFLSIFQIVSWAFLTFSGQIAS